MYCWKIKYWVTDGDGLVTLQRPKEVPVWKGMHVEMVLILHCWRWRALKRLQLISEAAFNKKNGAVGSKDQFPRSLFCDIVIVSLRESLKLAIEVLE